MDKILQPLGFWFLTALDWNDWLVVVESGMDALTQQDENLLIARKKMFQAHQSTIAWLEKVFMVFCCFLLMNGVENEGSIFFTF